MDGHGALGVQRAGATSIAVSSRVFVTGGAGFLGRSICRLVCAQGLECTIYARAQGPAMARTSKIVGDIRDAAALSSALRGHDAIVHLAAEWNDVGVSASEYETTNVVGTKNVVLAAANLGVKTIVFASSSAVYDFEDGRGVQEYAEGDSADHPPTLYGQTKVLGERLLQTWASEDPTRRLCMVRPSVIYGPENRGNVYNLIRQVLSPLFIFPNPKNV